MGMKTSRIRDKKKKKKRFFKNEKTSSAIFLIFVDEICSFLTSNMRFQMKNVKLY